MKYKTINLPLDGYHLNNVIHIGAGNGLYAQYYDHLNLKNAIWIEQSKEFYSNLYRNTIPFQIKNQYYFTRLSNIDNVHEQTFKSFWRNYSCNIDIEKYDLLTLDIRSESHKIIEGFDNFKNNFRVIVFLWPDSISEEYMQSIGYNLEYKSDHVLYARIS